MNARGGHCCQGTENTYIDDCAETCRSCMSYCPIALDLTVLSRICHQPIKLLRLRGVSRHLQLRVPTLDIRQLLDVFCLDGPVRQRRWPCGSVPEGTSSRSCA